MGKYDALLLRLAPQSRSNLPAMLAARRRMVDHVVDSNPLLPGQLVGRSDQADAILQAEAGISLMDHLYRAEVRNAAKMAEERYARQQAIGVFTPSADRDGPFIGVVTYPRWDRSTRRHEILHGLTEAARRGEDGMPYWSQLAAANPLGLGEFIDELSAVRAGRQPVLRHPWGSYARRFSEWGHPASAAAAAGLEAVPYAGAAAVGTGIGFGGLLARDAMYPEEPEQPSTESIAGQFDRQVDILRRRRPD